MSGGRETDGDVRKVGLSAGNRGKGRKKGVPNKTTVAMKEAIMHVYDALQTKAGKDHGHFVDWAEDNPTEFYKLAAKLIPIQLDHSGGVQIVTASSADERI